MAHRICTVQTMPFIYYFFYNVLVQFDLGPDYTNISHRLTFIQTSSKQGSAVWCGIVSGILIFLFPLNIPGNVV